MSAPATPWPAALAGTPAVSVIERAIERQRLSHSLLLHGDDWKRSCRRARHRGPAAQCSGGIRAFSGRAAS